MKTASSWAYDGSRDEQSRAVLCRGHVIDAPTTSSVREQIASELEAWAKSVDGRSGDMTMRFIAHDADRGSSAWMDKPFIVGVFIREVFGLDGDHLRGLTEDELAGRCLEANARLDAFEPLLVALLAAHGAKLGPRKLLLTWDGPLASARIVKGTWREAAGDAPYWYDVTTEDDDPKTPPAFYDCCEGASQDAAPGGAFGFQIAMSVFEDRDPPIELTADRLNARDERIRAHGLEDVRLFVFSHYD